jgi:putative heme iron utilization protein
MAKRFLQNDKKQQLFASQCQAFHGSMVNGSSNMVSEPI